MANSIQIDGKEYDVLGMSDDRRGIHTSAGTFWMSPVCFGHFGKLVRSSLTGYADQKQLMRGRLITEETKLPNPIPKSIRKITFLEPDISDPDADTVKAFYKGNKSKVDELFAEHKATCKQAGVKPYTLAEFKAYRTKRAVMRAEHGFDDTMTDSLLMRAFAGQGVADSTSLLASITHEVIYPAGEVVYLDSLEPERLSESLRKNTTKDRSPSTPDASGDRLNSQKAAAAYIGRDPKTLREWVENGWVPEYRHKPNGRPWYFKTELDRVQPGVPFDSDPKSKK